MIGRRSIFFWLLLVAGLGLAAWWLLFVPYRPQRLYSAIPINATFISEQRDLAARWDSFSKNPVTLSLLGAAGIKTKDVEDLAKDPVSRAWFDKLAARDVVMAYVPNVGPGGDPAWVLVSWLGGKSQRLRWDLSWGRIPDFTAQPAYRGRVYWKVNDADLEADQVLTVAFVEGMLVGCIASQPQAMREVLDTYDGLLPAITRNANFPGTGPWCSDPLAPDRGWINMPGAPEPSSWQSGFFSYEFLDVATGSISGQICGQAPFNFAQPAFSELRAGENLTRLFGKLPQSLILTRSSLVLPMIESPLCPAWLRITGELIREQNADTLLLAMTGDEYSGHFKGLRVPALLVGIPVEDAPGARRWIEQALDRLNARYRWGLIPRSIRAGTNTIYVIEETTTNFYTHLTLDEKIAYAQCGNWLLFSSNLETLQKLVARYDQPESLNEADECSWAKEMNDVKASGYAWFDLERSGKTIRLALATYSLKLLLEDPRGSQPLRQQLNEAKAWIDTLAPLGRACFWLRADGKNMEIKFKAGS